MMTVIQIAEALGFSYETKLQDNIGIPRSKMPQIHSRLALADVIAKLSTKYSVKPTTMQLGSLKFTQNEINQDKVKKMIDKGIDDDPFYIVSKENRLADGHHTYASQLEIDGSKHRVEVYKVDLPIKKLLDVLNKMKHTTKSN